MADLGVEHLEAFRYQGSMVPLDPVSDPLIGELVASRRICDALELRGAADLRWLSAYLISKPAMSPGLWWHQDWWAWQEPISFAEPPSQLFVMLYLQDVSEHNGALRVIPGSHTTLHPLVDQLPEPHSHEINRAGSETLAHATQPDEVTVNVVGGDVVVGDARLLHATHPNSTSERRTCLTLWYLPNWQSLPASVKAYLLLHPMQPTHWWRRADLMIPDYLKGLLPMYDGDARPATYCRVPGKDGSTLLACGASA